MNIRIDFGAVFIIAATLALVAQAVGFAPVTMWWIAAITSAAMSAVMLFLVSAALRMLSSANLTITPNDKDFLQSWGIPIAVLALHVGLEMWYLLAVYSVLWAGLLLVVYSLRGSIRG